MNMDNHRLVLLHLSLLKGIGPSIIARLMQTFESLEDIYQCTIPDFVHQAQLSIVSANLLYAGLHDKKQLDDELHLIEKYQIDWITIADEYYPPLLKEIYLPPMVLYSRGTPLYEYKKCLAVVGSRNAYHYGQKVIEKLVPPLIDNGWTIVSGGAIGADTMAHQQVLRCGGKTVVVLGSGLLQLYPVQNMRLFEKISQEGGALISSFSLQTLPMQGNFPARNRIIAGLSQGCIVIQAAARSGASITAMNALEQGREVFAVPGPITDELSVGCHRLLQQGAKLVIDAEDILQEFGEAGAIGEPGIQIEYKKEEEKASQEIIQTGLRGHILQVCKQPTSLDELVEKTTESLEKIQEVLFDLALEAKVMQDVSGRWVIHS
jgi:DNA processing protein